MADQDWSKTALTFAEAGLPILGSLLGGALGGPVGAKLGGAAASAVGEALGVDPTPDAIGAAVAADPAAAAAKLQDTEASFAALYQQEASNIAAVNTVVGGWSLFKDGWRPGLMWLIVAGWINTLLIAPYIAAGGFRVPAAPVESLMQFSSVVLVIIGGGHTAKAIFGKGAG